MSFKTWADGQDDKRQGDKTDGAKSNPAGAPVAPKPEQATAQTAPGNGEHKAG